MTLESIETVHQNATNRQKVLVVDDQPAVREALRLLLKDAGYAIETAASPDDALVAATNGAYDLIVVDMNFTRDTTSGEEGLRLVDALRAQRPGALIIATTGWSTIELAVEAMQRGACDFIPKPWDNRRFLSVVHKHLSERRRPASDHAAELEIARNVQRKLLPQPHFSGYGAECECASLPAREIGGDFYDFIEIQPGKIAFLLADVSGKGMGAALLAANLQASIRGQRELALVPEKLLKRVNQLFFESTRPEHFATVFYGVYDAASRSIRYASCGHPPAVLLRENGAFELLPSTATVLGAFQNLSLEERQIAMQRGDRLVLFSDGFSEAAIDAMPERISDGWALETIRSLGRSRGSGLAGALVSEAASVGKQADDITVMDVRVV